MSCMYTLWDIVDDTLSRKINESDASRFAELCGCCPSQGTFRQPHLYHIVLMILLQ